MKIAAIVLTKNESKNIGACLDTLAFADEKIVVDAGSDDNTKELALRPGVQFYTHPFSDFASQRNYAMSLTTAELILFIDADERVSDRLAAEIRLETSGAPRAFAIPRHNYFFGKRLKYSGSREDAPVRLFPKDSGVWKQPVHESFETSLPVKQLKEPLIHHTTRDLAHYLEKVKCYVPLEVETMRQQGRSAGWWDIVLRPPAKFFYLYLVKLGFLDGVTGLQFSFLSAYYDYKKYSLFCRSQSR